MGKIQDSTQVIKNIESDSIESENRIDENGAKAFQSMGYKTRLSDNAVMLYKSFKSKKDRLQPGRLTPEGYAFIAVLADMSDGKLKLE